MRLISSIVRTLLIRLLCNVCTAPALANTTGSMPTQLCLGDLQTLWSAQLELGRSAASKCFYTDPRLLKKRMTRGSLTGCQYSYVATTATCMRAQACTNLHVFGCARHMPDHQIYQLELCALCSSGCSAMFARRRRLPIQLDLCQHSSACATFKRCGQLSWNSADQPLQSAFTPIPDCSGNE